jgi:energy-coupling factor transporter ATP-binding protein EcfA2
MRLFRRHKLKNVFTPSTIAKLTYIERRELENDLKKFLELPGMQIVLYGHSGCGKSTLINNKLDELKIKSITTRCDSATTFNDIIIRAFDKLNVFYNCERTHKSTSTIKSEFSSKYKEIGSLLSTESSVEKGSVDKRALPLLLTPQRLAEFMGAANCVWIIEDFHKVASDEKKKIADILKIFIDTTNEFKDSNLKIICIGAVGTARELIELDTNLSTRIAEIYVPLLKEDELAEIAEKGFKLLNIHHNGGVKSKIVYYSNNLASICHQICYDICYNKQITKTKIFPERIFENDFKQSVSSYVRKNTDTFTKIYDKICTNENNKNILISIIQTEKEYCSDNEILKELKKIQSVPKPIFINNLNELCTINYDEVLRFDRNSKRYSFSSPFFQAFVKMKLALEKLENEERSVRKARKYDLKNDMFDRYPMSIILNEDFLKNYYQELDTYYARRIAELERLKEIEERMRTMKRNK